MLSTEPTVVHRVKKNNVIICENALINCTLMKSKMKMFNGPVWKNVEHD